MRRYTVVLALALLGIAGVLPPAGSTATATGDDAARIVDLINQERTSRGLSPLSSHSMLVAAAQAHSKDMVENSFCDHDSSDGTSWSTRIREHGYDPSYGLAENVACGHVTPEQVVDAWMGSAGHRNNILGDYAHIGVGLYEYFWTADFGKPAPDTPPPCTLEYDFNSNGIVGAGDVGLVTEHWGDGVYDPAYDLNLDNTINVVDVMTVTAKWGTTCQ